MTDYDVIIAGAGIVGLAAGLKILEFNPKAKVLILEKENDIAKHQTGHNSGVIHSGIYYKPGSLKAQNCLRGYKQLLEFCDKENVKYDICGKVIVAVDESELKGLNDIYERGLANGLDKIKRIGKEELKEIEPHATGIEAIRVPYTGIVDFKEVARRYYEKILLLGGKVEFNSRITNVKELSGRLDVSSWDRSYNAKVFVNCCGLQSDEVAKKTGLPAETRIIPFRGEYYKIRPEKRYLVKNLIYPVPDPAFPFLGVHFTRMISGEVEAGPNAVLAFRKEGYSRSSFSIPDTFKTFTWGGFYRIAAKYYKTGMGEFYRSYRKKAFVKALSRLLPEIQENDLVPGGAGVRAQAIDKKGKLIDDFLITGNRGIINVINAPSPAATSSMAIGETIAKQALAQI
jgi:(S)-2-hydroxyglutarate dehydrogenase